MTNKSVISTKVSKNIGISYHESHIFLKKFLSLVILNSKTKKVKINNFGVFTYHKTPKRVGRNPKTKESFIITPTFKPVFKTSKFVKGVLNWQKNF